MLRASRLIPMLLVLGLALPGCMGGGKTVRMTTDPGIPAAQGTVEVSTGDNDNTKLEVKVQHLAPPARVVAGATTYVVWIRGVEASASPQNAGAILVDDDLNGQLKTVTALQAFDLYITAEASSTVPMPTGRELLSARLERE